MGNVSDGVDMLLDIVGNQAYTVANSVFVRNVFFRLKRICQDH
jgi:hypothetical protein